MNEDMVSLQLKIQYWSKKVSVLYSTCCVPHRTVTKLSTTRANYRANLALTLQSFFYCTSNVMYGILGVVMNILKSNVREISS